MINYRVGLQERISLLLFGLRSRKHKTVTLSGDKLCAFLCGVRRSVFYFELDTRLFGIVQLFFFSLLLFFSSNFLSDRRDLINTLQLSNWTIYLDLVLVLRTNKRTLMSFSSRTQLTIKSECNQSKCTGQSLQIECKHENFFLKSEMCCGCDPRLLYRFSHNGHVPCNVEQNIRWLNSECIFFAPNFGPVLEK